MVSPSNHPHGRSPKRASLSCPHASPADALSHPPPILTAVRQARLGLMPHAPMVSRRTTPADPRTLVRSALRRTSHGFRGADTYFRERRQRRALDVVGNCRW